ncbi:MAG TPA: hypothetical protein VFG62_08655 [Rhodopila sp.]|jgi:hypothetical protein|nr:hypothetical protein [Rhodopila sp.]
MILALITEFGWCGFGKLKDEIFPGYRLGFVRISYARGSLKDAIIKAVKESKAAKEGCDQ